MYSQNKYFYVCDRQILNPGLRTLHWWFVAWCQVQCCLFRTKSWDAAQVNLAKHTSDLQHIRIWVNFLALCIQYPFTVAWWGTSHCCIALLILLPWLQGQSYLCSMMMVGWSCYTQRKKLGCLSDVVYRWLLTCMGWGGVHISKVRKDYGCSKDLCILTLSETFWPTWMDDEKACVGGNTDFYVSLKNSGCWREGSAIKCTCYSYRGTEFGSQHWPWVTHNHL